MKVTGFCWCHLRHMPRHVFNDLMLLYEAEAEVAKHRRG
jgi:hypothetical protein